MDHIIYTAMSGANAAGHRQAVLSNNLANVSTNGFRAELSTFRAVPVQGDGASTRVMALEATAGHRDTPGPAQNTGRALDAMASGNAWFAVQGLDGALTYLGVHIWGMSIEANPLVSSAVSVAGVGGGLAAAKLFAVGLGIVLHLRRIHLIVALLSAFYIAVAILPWAVLFMTL